ncbi:unnamed protein product [Rotaria magnacalcarata]|uniref:LYR motif-containing protein 9 n=1 Tax=Rotaria magnacalcarata TaxID=392030 RepID=A0A816LRV0_9BILA|nr:unnamed protein product [Rotaria magnacalcarata]CAF1547023.1 unnamed protein product [Rotaria magnacalcarata]CAF1956314.1 unnamed protein product [Rotaria magnacalcarata]CAF1992153.1 unnamed protein product [Rotaria magnacalcarata]CAF2041061.1 unnamed protein product [Rotaria magnacalcarata]
MKAIPQTPIQLYKYLLREIPKLPVESQPYYRNYVKGNFRAHVDEVDSQRINELVRKLYQDFQWIIKKYEGKMGK